MQSWQRDFAGNVTASVDALNRTTTYVYQYGAGKGDLIQVTNPDGTSAYYQYDATFHHLTREQDEDGHVTTDTYNAQGDRISMHDALGQVTSYVWSGGLLQSVTDPNGDTTSYQYDSARRLVAVTDALNQHTTYTYDNAGNPITIRDPLGRTTQDVYDGMRRLVRETDAAGGVTTTTYNAQGQVTSRTDRWAM